MTSKSIQRFTTLYIALFLLSACELAVPQESDTQEMSRLAPIPEEVPLCDFLETYLETRQTERQELIGDDTFLFKNDKAFIVEQTGDHFEILPYTGVLELKECAVEFLDSRYVGFKRGEEK